MAIEKDNTSTDEETPRPVTPDPEAMAAIRAKLQRDVGHIAHFTPVGAVMLPPEPTFAHNCPGELGSVTYQDESGKWHNQGYTWYACDNYLELTADYGDLSPH
ncbi:MAG: hypothetical protein INR72_13615 [Williamsia herbipolensis]|nr:hypothetical protein [Williamsia herbipolensis]